MSTKVIIIIIQKQNTPIIWKVVNNQYYIPIYVYIYFSVTCSHLPPNLFILTIHAFLLYFIIDASAFILNLSILLLTHRHPINNWNLINEKWRDTYPTEIPTWLYRSVLLVYNKTLCKPIIAVVKFNFDFWLRV